MTLARGEEVYTTGAPPCIGIGLKWSGEEYSTALQGPVAAVLFDDVGRGEAEEMLSEFTDTHFDQTRLNRIFSGSRHPKPWQVGEAIAEAWLVAHRNCYFPWSVKRDMRKQGSSLPGADLVGLHVDSHGNCIAFGEVKTSSEERYPPRNMYGDEGLRKQLKDIRDNTAVRDDLFRYLTHRAVQADWKERFQEAARRYIANQSDVRLFGFLVRDVSPNEMDLKGIVRDIGRNCPDSMIIEIFGLYIQGARMSNAGNVLINHRMNTKP